ncbi:hypothetical protein RFI_16277 [Reticulomyxa filosa]|uniref:Acyltransferase n=1 Tax=Reticulomyxa filosa TaxID=46433 RepID=X6N5B8_RETFI|nr:hypothetical protein RFI_16277 [Reticulomyxa filosa]|eukprot:ETO20924.1 hypothetical protein RFI_16277 [Reticulomyxa filosa]
MNRRRIYLVIMLIGGGVFFSRKIKNFLSLSNIRNVWNQPFVSGQLTAKKIMCVFALCYVVWIFTFGRNASRISNQKNKDILNWPLIRKPADYLKHEYFPATNNINTTIFIGDNNNICKKKKRGARWNEENKQTNFFFFYKKKKKKVLMRDYEEGQLDPNRKYIILLHPHGIISVGGILHFMASDAFPELDYRIVTISFNFFVPLVRELFLMIGLADASQGTIRSLLQRNISVSFLFVAIVVGGAQEALDARPKTNELTLATRVGFAQVALEEGTDIIPVFTFGENDLFDPLFSTSQGSWLRTLNENLFKRILTFVVPLINPIPKRRPIHTIIGKPIPVTQIKNASLEDILELHYRYVNSLQDLYDRYKHLYPQGDGDLKIIDKVTTKDIQKWRNRSRSSKL